MSSGGCVRVCVCGGGGGGVAHGIVYVVTLLNTHGQSELRVDGPVIRQFQHC